jgi:uncharacterized protein YlzI (FlbEa/FlbD family)
MFISLTTKNNNRGIIFNVNHIVAIEEINGVCNITTSESDGCWEVQEDLEDVLIKIKEARRG